MALYAALGLAASETDDDSDESSNWINRFCSSQPHAFFCHVHEDFIKDTFNLNGLDVLVPFFNHSLQIILDVQPPYDSDQTEERNRRHNSCAEKLYGLIHARYIVSIHGLAAMLEKFRIKEFGVCPRVGCKNQPCLPVGESDLFGVSRVKIFCPRCEEIYSPRLKLEGSVDGACFGTTFPHLFLLTYPEMRPQKPSQSYVPRVFGFKIRKISQPETQSTAAATTSP